MMTKQINSSIGPGIQANNTVLIATLSHLVGVKKKLTLTSGESGSIAREGIA
jgi:hypothetical protein